LIVLQLVFSSFLFGVQASSIASIEIDAGLAESTFVNVTDIRGGADPASEDSAVQQYLSTLEGDELEFHVQGWRWHSLSFIRDAGRLEALALQLLERGDVTVEDGEMLNKAAGHVIDFNLAGLDNVEQSLWFPWLREKLCGATSKVREDMRYIMNRTISSVVEERRHISRLADAVRQQAKLASSPSVDAEKRKEAILNVAEMSAALTSRMRSVFDREDRILVPAVALIIPEREQRALSKKVIRKLGVLDSRRHLVGMHDAIWEGSDVRERELFEEEIPYLARTMIPRWRRLLYLPAAGMLDGIQPTAPNARVLLR